MTAEILSTKLKKLAVFLMLAFLFTAGWIKLEEPFTAYNCVPITKIPTDNKVCAITFDDGPHPITTTLILDTLKRHGVRATFFVVGQKAEQYPELLAQIKADGHQIACHSYSHINMVKYGHLDDYLIKDIKKWESAVMRITDADTRLYRPPGGDYDSYTLKQLSNIGYKMALWSLNSGDWKQPPSKTIVRRMAENVHPGAVILLHDGGIQTIDALPDIIKRLTDKGYAFKTMSEITGEGKLPSPAE